MVTLYCDGSKKALGGTLLKDGRSLESRDYWVDNSQDINILNPGLCSVRSSRLRTFALIVCAQRCCAGNATVMSRGTSRISHD